MRSFVLLTLALGAALLPGAHAAPSVATPSPRVVQGTTQQDGENARPGQTFTIGKQNPLNFTLRSAEYSTGRVVIGNTVYFPAASEKLLILHYTVHNPQPKEQRYYWADVNFTAVDAQDRNHNFVQAVAREGTSEPLELKLKPAQKVEVMTVIRVPAAGPVPKLIVQRSGDEQVLRYDLRGEVRKLSAPFADPADASGTSALPLPRTAAGTLVPLGALDVRLEDVHFSSETLGGRVPSAGHRYLVATFTLKNPLPNDARYSWSSLTPNLKDAEGEKVAYNQQMLKATHDEAASGTLSSGEEVKVRYAFELPLDVAADTLSVSDSSGRGYTYDVTSAR
ncbi:hypothetical protein [Deinococcus ruber]|uniref:DUF4352 domain-containing protein n=1 Tax=Deinococcus ruber TaxID=1848197 RepID=A0A918CNW9_9DEIO|nr:hypothetical protein [Deinococcus ruber]GGR30919.1 hypothetical protein GCM10008957_47060 [Deinococcus ruber]